MPFERPHHQRIASVLQGLDGELLRQPLARRKRIGHLTKSLLHGAFVIGHRNVAACCRQIETRLTQAPIENGQGNARHESPGPAAGGKQAIELGAGRPQAAGQCDAREKRSARGLHIGLRGCQTFFRCPDVRPRRQQFGRQAHLQGGEHRVIRPVLSGQRRHHLRHAEQLRQGMRL